jgi:type II secretion system protein D
MRSILRPFHLLIPLAALLAIPLAVPPLGSVPVLAQAGAEMVKLTFPNADVRDVLTQYELLVGKRVLYDNTVQGQVNINVPEVPKEEAIRIIEITLLMNGYHLVPSDIDPNLVKATGIGRAPRSVGVPIFAEPEPIPENEQVIMYMVKLRYADPTELAQVLQQAMPASRQEYSPNIVALPKAQAILVTENTSVLRGLMRIIRSADLEPTRVDGEFITLQRASAKDVVQMLEKLFEKPQTGATPGAPRPAVVPPKPADGANPAAAPSPLTTVELGGMTEDSMVAGKVRLTADERTNRIYVVSRPSNIPVLRKLIQQFDEDVPFNEPLVRPLKFVSAGDILDALVKAVSDPGTKDAGVAGAGGNAQGRPQSQSQANATGAGSQFGNRGGLGGGGGLSGGGGGESLSLQGEQKEIIPTTILVGNARIMADKRRNAILVIGSQDMKEKVGNILNQLDVRSPQVMLTTVIGELTLTEGQDFGVNYLLHNGRRDLLKNGTVTGSAVSAAGNSMSLNLAQLLADPRSTRMMTAGAGGLGGFISAGNSLAAILTALESTSKFKVTHRPTLFASNNKTATIISGERVAVVTGSQATPLGNVAGNSVVNQVQYINVNLKLQVIPLINSDKEVNLDILQTLAEITRYEDIKDSTGSNKYPVISDRQLSTTVLVPNEGTLVLGGLVKDSQNRNRSGIPVLGKLPLLGGLFRSTSNKKDRTELVVLIRPSVSLGPEDVYEIRDRNMKPMRIPMNLEDDLVLPDPGLSKSGKRSGDPSFSSASQLKPFRANADTVQAADVRGVRVQNTPPPTPANPAEATASEKNTAEAAESGSKKKKSLKPQPTSAAE